MISAPISTPCPAWRGVDEIDNDFEITADRLRGTTMFLDEASVTATENTVMAACLAHGRTIIKHAACEPHVEDVAVSWSRWARAFPASAAI